MGTPAEVFNIIKDSATGAGEALISRIEGEAAAAQEGLIGFSFKDSSGNVVLPTLTPAGAISVDRAPRAIAILMGSLGLAVGILGCSETPPAESPPAAGSGARGAGNRV